jgi:hypothetical protein
MESRVWSGISLIPQGLLWQTLVAVHSSVPYVDSNTYSSLVNLPTCIVESVQQNFRGVKEKEKVAGNLSFLQATSVYDLPAS